MEGLLNKASKQKSPAKTGSVRHSGRQIYGTLEICHDKEGGKWNAVFLSLAIPVYSWDTRYSTCNAILVLAHAELQIHQNYSEITWGGEEQEM